MAVRMSAFLDDELGRLRMVSVSYDIVHSCDVFRAGARTLALPFGFVPCRHLRIGSLNLRVARCEDVPMFAAVDQDGIKNGDQTD